jgi:hypothetical protein
VQVASSYWLYLHRIELPFIERGLGIPFTGRGVLVVQVWTFILMRKSLNSDGGENPGPGLR